MRKRISSYVALLIADPHQRLVVAQHYIGGNTVAYAAREVLRREPDHTDSGFESWGNLTSDEARAIVERRYIDGVSPETVAEWVERYPPELFLWCLTRDY